jgi:hypothetical protein
MYLIYLRPENGVKEMQEQQGRNTGRVEEENRLRRTKATLEMHGNVGQISSNLCHVHMVELPYSLWEEWQR